MRQITPPPSAMRRAWMTRPLALNLIALAALLAGYVLAFTQLQAYESGVTRQEFTVAGAPPVPVLRLTPTTPRGNLVAVLVHGYSGSKEMMLGFGIELAKMGVTTYLLDLPGHGASGVPSRTPQDRRRRPPCW